MSTEKPTYHMHAVMGLVFSILIGSTAAHAQTAPTAETTFTNSSDTAWTTVGNWDNGVPVAVGTPDDAWIGAGNTAFYDLNALGNPDTDFFGTLTLGANSTFQLKTATAKGIPSGGNVYFSDGSHLEYTAGSPNRSCNFYILSGASATYTVGANSIFKGIWSGSGTLLNVMLNGQNYWGNDCSGYSGELRFSTAGSGRYVYITGGSSGTGVTTFDNGVWAQFNSGNTFHDSATIKLVGGSGRSGAKLDMQSKTDTVGDFVVESPTGTADLFERDSGGALTVTNTVTFQGTAAVVGLNDTQGTPSGNGLITSNMTFTGTGSWTLNGDCAIGLTGGTITTTTNAAINNPLSGSFTKAGSATLTLGGSSAPAQDAITVTAGTLSFTNSSRPSPYGTLSVDAGTTLDLDYTGTGNTLYLNLGGSPAAAGEWGGIGAGAANTNALIAGTGFIVNGDGGVENIFFWDGGDIDIAGSGNLTSAGGSGSWNTTTSNWDKGYMAHVAWGNTTADEAVFAGTPGTVALDSDINVGRVRFDTGTYTIGDGAETHILNFGVGSTVTVDGVSATLQAGITGSPDVEFSSSTDTLTLSPAGSLTMAVGNITGYNNNAGNYNMNLGGSSTGNTAAQIYYQQTGSAHRWFITKTGSGTWTVNDVGGNSALMDIYVNDGTFVWAGDVGGIEWIRVGNAPGDAAVLEFSNSGASLVPGRFEAYGGIVSNSSGGPLTFTDGDLYLRSDGITFVGGNMDMGTGSTTMQSSDNPITVEAGTTVTIGGVVDDDTAVRNLEKKGGGTLDLNGNNTYNGNTIVSAGTLSIAHPCLDDAAQVSVVAGATLDLDFSGTDYVFAVFFDGVLAAAGTWGSESNLTATYTTNALTGTGTLYNGGGLAPAGTYYWDGSNEGGAGDGASDGGAGTWSTAVTNWDIGLPPRVVWSDDTANKAIFRTSAGSVDLASDITLGEILIDGVDNYEIGSNPETQVLNFGGTNTIVIDGVHATIRAGITGSPDIHTPRGHRRFLYLRPDSSDMTLGKIYIGVDSESNPELHLLGTTSNNSVESIPPAHSYAFLTKDGSSTWRLGDVDVRKTTLKGGKLVINGSMNTYDNNALVWTAGTLGGTGTVQDDVTVPASGSLAPGDPAGTFTVTNKTCTINGHLAVAFNGAACSKLVVYGNLNISAGTSQLDVDSSGASGSEFVIAECTSLTGEFGATNGLPASWSVEYVTATDPKQIKLILPPGGTVIIFR